MRFSQLRLAAVALAFGGCAQTVRQAAREAAPPAAATAIQSLTRPEQQKSLEALGTSPGMQRATWSLGNAIGNGIVAEVLAEAGIGPPPELAPGAPAPTTQAIAGSPGTTGPAAATTESSGARPMAGALPGQLNRMIGRGIESATGPEAQEQVRRMAEATTDGAMRGIARGFREQMAPELDRAIRQQFAPAISEGIRKDVGPALALVIKEQLIPGLHDAAAQTLREVLGQSSSFDVQKEVRGVAQSGTLGVHDAMAQFAHPDPLEALTKTLTRISWIALVLLIVAGVLAIGLIGSVAAPGPGGLPW